MSEASCVNCGAGLTATASTIKVCGVCGGEMCDRCYNSAPLIHLPEKGFVRVCKQCNDSHKDKFRSIDPNQPNPYIGG